MLALKETKNKGMVIGLPAVIFAALHLSNNGVTLLAVVNLICCGLLVGYCFYQSGSIWLPIGLQIFWNFVQGNIYGFHVSGVNNNSLLQLKTIRENIVTGGEFGPEGGLGVTIALCLSFVYVIFRYRKSPKGQFLKE